MFAEYLADNNMDWILNPPIYKYILPRGTYDAALLVEKMMEEDVILVEPDPDPDGYLSAKCWQYTFDRLGFTRYKIDKLVERVHNVKWEKIKAQLDAGITAVILVDSSTNNIDLIKNICSYQTKSGRPVKLLIVDHHQAKYSLEAYPENCLVINPKLEDHSMPYYSVSAGVVNALVCSYILMTKGVTDTRELLLYGYITMYSDTCAVDNPYTASMMRLCLHEYRHLPQFIKLFWDDYSTFNKSFLSFKVIPIINALIRMNRFDLVDTIFYHTYEIQDEMAFKSEVMQVRDRSKQIVENLLEIIEVNADNKLMVIGLLPGDLSPEEYNHMGLVANKLATEHKKVALCLYLDKVTGMYVGSARDYLNRDILSDFSTIFEKSAGHSSAFGVYIEQSKWHLLTEIFSENASKEEEEKKEEYISFDYNLLSSDKELEQMALYNELAIIGLPKACIDITLHNDFQLSNNKDRTKFVAKTKTMNIVSFSKPLIRFSTIKCMPAFNGGIVECKIIE